MPVHDWQFWVVTAAFLFAAAWVLGSMLPIPLLRRLRRGSAGKKAGLTVEGKPVGKGTRR